MIGDLRYGARMEKLAEQLYVAITALLQDSTTTGLLAAVADAKSRVPFDKTTPKVRTLFITLAENLTKAQGQR